MRDIRSITIVGSDISSESSKAQLFATCWTDSTIFLISDCGTAYIAIEGYQVEMMDEFICRCSQAVVIDGSAAHKVADSI